VLFQARHRGVVAAVAASLQCLPCHVPAAPTRWISAQTLTKDKSMSRFTTAPTRPSVQIASQVSSSQSASVSVTSTDSIQSQMTHPVASLLLRLTARS